MQRILIGIGILLLIAGLFYPWIAKLGLGSLPGDVNIKGERFSFHFPLVTCLVLSAALTGIMWLLRRFQ